MAQPVAKVYTIADYAALGETEYRTELVEGQLIMVPGPTADHNNAGARLWRQLDDRLPPEFEAILDVDIDLQLVPAGRPGYSRRPDLIVVRREVRQRLRVEGGFVRASEVLLAVEIVSPSSVRTDNRIKRAEYAEAGIPHYWIVDLAEPVSALACHQAGAFGYADGGEVTGTLRVTEPFAAEIDLSALR